MRSMRRVPVAAILSLLALAAACTGESTPGDPPAAGAAGVVDSAIPRDEALRRFRDGLEPVDSLGGRSTRDSLADAFVRAVAASDTAGLNELVLSRREFGWLFYPHSPQGLPPYDVSPQLMWDLLVRQSDRGLVDVFTRLGGKQLRLVGYDCGAEPAQEGPNRVWGPCTMTLVVPPADTVTNRLTGPMLERHGRFKFVSYTNELD